MKHFYFYSFWFAFMLSYLFSLKSIQPAEFILITLGFILSLYDIKSCSYPFLIWLFPSLTILMITTPTFHSLILLGIGIFAEYKPIKIGSGDFFFLASLGLCLNVEQLLWVIQLASLSALVSFMIKRERHQPLPFIPYLYLAFLFILTL